MLSAWAATSASSSLHSYFPASKVQPSNILYDIHEYIFQEYEQAWKYQNIFETFQSRIEAIHKTGESVELAGPGNSGVLWQI